MLRKINSFDTNKFVKIDPKEFGEDFSCSIFAVDGSKNPSGSIKDKTVISMLDSYKESGKLVPGATIIEATSGNTGISLAYFSNLMDYRCVIVLPKTASDGRKCLIKKYNGDIVEADGGMKECSEKAQELCKNTPNSFIFNQFTNDNNHLAHYKTTGPEIFGAFENIDYIFAGIGTGGTISGIGKFFKQFSPKTKIIGIEPEESPLITRGIANPHVIEGIGANFVPKTYHNEFVDEVITVNGQNSIKMAKEINDNGVSFVGYSSGAALLGAFNYIKNNKLENKNIIVIFPDKGDRYIW